MEAGVTADDATLLRLLVRRPALETADVWDVVFEKQKEMEAGRAAVESASPSASSWASCGGVPLVQIGRVVPCLPEYITAGQSLAALMLHCQSRYPTETSAVIRGWIREGTRLSHQFRQWLLCDWLSKCSHLYLPHGDASDSDGDGERLLWHEALLIAALDESQKPLRRVLLLLLDEVGAPSRSSERQGGRDERANAEPGFEADSRAAALSMDSVSGLLDFYWLHAAELARFAALCAAKLRRVVVERASAGPLADQEEVGARMRWCLLDKPVLFEPLLRHGLALGVFAVRPDSTSSYHCVVPSDDMRLLAGMTIQNEGATHRLGETVSRLRSASDAAAVHIRPDSFQHCILPTDTLDRLSKLRSLSPMRRTRLLEEFERDLDEAPAYLFPHILLAFAAFIKTCWSSLDSSDVDKTAVRLLFDLFERRAGDGRSCLQILAVTLDLRVADFSVWRDTPQLYVDVCEGLYASATFQVSVSTQVQWAAQMALQQLLLECDVSVAEASLAALSAILPYRLLHLARLRLH